MSSMLRLAAFGIASALATGCGAPTESPDGDVGVAAEAADCVNCMNGHNGLIASEVTTSALMANPLALAFLGSHPLKDAVDTTPNKFTDYADMRLQLHDLNARKVMSYVVSCALPVGRSLTYVDPFWSGPPPLAGQPSPGSQTFQGELGLCYDSTTTPTTDWETRPPSEDCLEKVSACLLARINQDGVRVPISMHGAVGAGASQPILPETVYRDRTNIKSLLSCNPLGLVMATPNGKDRNCGFQGVSVGRCTPGDAVTVGAGAYKGNCAVHLGAATGDTVLRVCGDIYGCDHLPAGAVASYTSNLGEGDDECGTNPSVTFTCPTSGFFSVMAANWNSSLPQDNLDPTKFVVQVAGTKAVLPATQAAIFGALEGAFYGNFFDVSTLSDEVNIHVDATGSTVGNAWTGVGTFYKRRTGATPRGLSACYSPTWGGGLASLTSRLCALPGNHCLMQIAGACDSLCWVQPAPGQDSYQWCMDQNGSAWGNAVTTYVHVP